MKPLFPRAAGAFLYMLKTFLTIIDLPDYLPTQAGSRFEQNNISFQEFKLNQNMT